MGLLLWVFLLPEIPEDGGATLGGERAGKRGPKTVPGEDSDSFKLQQISLIFMC